MTHISPRYRVIAIDETEYWNPEITAIVGRIAAVYIVNFAETTHICSLTGSYWAEFVCNITEHPYRAPDGHIAGSPIWDSDWAVDFPEEFARSLALYEAWGVPFYGLEYENGGESGMYISESFREPDGDLIDLDSDDWDQDTSEMEPEEAAKYRRQRDHAAHEAVHELIANGEDWQSIAPWNM